MNDKDLLTQEQDLVTEYAAHLASGLKLDLTRGKPSPAQVALSDDLGTSLSGNYQSGNIDTRNYGGLDGLSEARKFGASLLGVNEAEVLAGGNASLTLMYQYLSCALHHGALGPDTAWKREQVPLKFLCVVPGYDRHFLITEDLGFESVNVRMTENGPDMDEVEKLVATDHSIKGIWCVPKYQNPTGHTFSDSVVRRFARLGKLAGPGFRIMWDNAYAVHDLYSEGDLLANIMDECRKENTTDSVAIFGSTSKITRAGSGISFLAASPDNLAHFKRRLGIQTIGPDKVNQLAHVRFLKDLEGVKSHMQRHAELVRPKFEVVLSHLDNGLVGIATWTRPRGGYFISLNACSGVASEAVRLSGEAGVKLTPAGATYPGGNDPNDSNIRLAPTYPSIDELNKAMPVVITSVRLATIRRRLAIANTANHMPSDTGS